MYSSESLMAATQKTNVAIVERLYDAFNRGDLGECMAGFADDITWTNPEGSPISSGTFHGPDAVLENAFLPLGEQFERFEVTVDRFIDGGDTVVMEGTHRSTLDGGIHKVPAVHVLDMQDGKVQQFTSYEDTALEQQLLSV